ncbi:hypothetical protein IE4803_PB00021 (plasmid) [Rhizobium etli bv. phaseoli str. IE4803]|nr:hypothetical protein IE4803_PB00021 [Rhizobium etli bv. phaseoli str. IE4803]
MSLEQLVDWSVECIGGFEPGYDDIGRHLGLVSPTLRLVTDRDVSRQTAGATPYSKTQTGLAPFAQSPAKRCGLPKRPATAVLR